MAASSRPPIIHIAVFVEQTSLVIKAVSHFVTDYHAYCPIINCIISIGIEEWRLKYGSGEADFVGGGIEISVHHLRRHAPFAFVGGFAEFVHIVGNMPDACGGIS